MNSEQALPQPQAIERHLRRLLAAPQAPWLHQEVAGRMAEKLSIILLQPTHLVDWWSELGGAQELLVRTYPKASTTRVEPNAHWLARAVQKTQQSWWAKWVKTHPGVEASLSAQVKSERAQLVWANMVLHAASNPLLEIQRWLQALTVDGFVMFSCLGPDSFRELRSLFVALGWGLAAQPYTDMHDWGDMLVEAGFADPVMDQESLTLTWASAESLLADLRALGGNAAAQRFNGLRSRAWRAALTEQLTQRLAGPDGRLKLTVELIYGHAFKPAPRARVQPETRISVDQMRGMVRTPRSS